MFDSDNDMSDLTISGHEFHKDMLSYSLRPDVNGWRWGAYLFDREYATGVEPTEPRAIAMAQAAFTTRLLAEIDALEPPPADDAADELAAPIVLSTSYRCGEFLQDKGGFFIGAVRVGNQNFGLVTPPRAVGEKGGLIWKTTWSETPGTQSVIDGWANTLAMLTAGNHPAAEFCRSITFEGHDDYYLPARDELEMMYRAFKPTDQANYTYESRLSVWSVEPGTYNGVDENGNGSNRHSRAAGSRYSESDPAITAYHDFRKGGIEAFDLRWYLSSTEFTSDSAWAQYFGDGRQGTWCKRHALAVRAVRRFPL